MFGISKFYKFSAEKKNGGVEEEVGAHIKIKERRQRWKGVKDKTEQFAKPFF